MYQESLWKFRATYWTHYLDEVDTLDDVDNEDDVDTELEVDTLKGKVTDYLYSSNFLLWKFSSEIFIP